MPDLVLSSGDTSLTEGPSFQGASARGTSDSCQGDRDAHPSTLRQPERRCALNSPSRKTEQRDGWEVRFSRKAQVWPLNVDFSPGRGQLCQDQGEDKDRPVCHTEKRQHGWSEVTEGVGDEVGEAGAVGASTNSVCCSGSLGVTSSL